MSPEEIQACKDLLCSKDDPDYEKVTLPELIIEATNNGDFFPASELKRRITEIDRLNSALRDRGVIFKAMTADLKRRDLILEENKKLRTKVEYDKAAMKTLQERIKAAEDRLAELKEALFRDIDLCNL